MSDGTLPINEEVVDRAARRCKERNVVIPTFAQMKDPSLIPADIRESLKGIGLWDVHPLNLFRISWKNDPKTGGFGGVNFFEVPREITGVKAHIYGLVGRNFPTGAHKVGASFGCLVPRLVTGRFDPTRQKAVWPSTGNYCRGGAYNSALLGCTSVAILPQEMSRERFEWLKSIGSEIIATPGCESNVKEIYDKCWELKAGGDSHVILNQFEEFGNPMWHYEVTASAIRELLAEVSGTKDRLFGYVSSTGSAGTIGAGNRLKEWYPGCKVIAAEALQCPTLLRDGFGAHRIEGIGDKHVPWIHDVRSTDMVVAVDDADPMALLRLFNEDAGRERLADGGVPRDSIERLDWLGISGLGNLCAAVKAAKWFELTERDILVTIFTDSMELYGSRIEELREAEGPYDAHRADLDWKLHMHGLKTDNMAELTHWDRRRIHNLKYYTWIEQQKNELDELNAQWDDPDYWTERLGMAPAYDRLIESFNARVRAL